MAACGYHFAARVVSRGKGQSAPRKAAYNARDRLIDQRLGDSPDYRRKGGLEFEGIFPPKDAPDWAHNREELWNHVEATEKRKDAQLARELEVAFPAELNAEQRLWLIKDYVRQEFVREGMVADLCLHLPDKDGDQRNYHAHILLTMRGIEGDEFGPKVREWNGDAQLRAWRGRFAEMSARALERAGYPEEAERWRHGHETLAEQRAAALARGDTAYADRCNQEPTKHRGPPVDAMARKGMETDSLERAGAAESRNDERAQLRSEIRDLRAEILAAEREDKAARPAHEPPDLAANVLVAHAISDSPRAFKTALSERGIGFAGEPDPAPVDIVKAFDGGLNCAEKIATKLFNDLAEFTDRALEDALEFLVPSPAPTREQVHARRDAADAREERAVALKDSKIDHWRYIADPDYRSEIMRREAKDAEMRERQRQYDEFRKREEQERKSWERDR